MVRLLSSAVAGAIVLGAAAQGCARDNEVCTGVDAAALGASQLQVKSDARTSRSYVAESEETEAKDSDAVDFGDAVTASLATGDALHSAAAEVRSAEERMRQGYSPSVSEIDDLITGMTGQVSSSQDKCSTQLYELKHQLTIIHEQVTSITVEVNSTEAGIYSYEEACKEKTTEISVIETSKKKHSKKCVTEMITVKKTLSVLKADMVQMKHISSAHIHIGGGYGNQPYPTGPYGGQGGGYRVSLLETAGQAEFQDDAPDGENREQRLDRVQSMVQKTKDMAQKANQCMTAAKAQQDQSDHDESQPTDENIAEVFLEIGENTSKHFPACSGINKPACGGAACDRGQWICPEIQPTGCPPNKPRCHPVHCYAGKWVCGKEPDSNCHGVIIELEHIFTTAYVSLTRLLMEYEETTHSTVCEESVEMEYNKEVSVVQTEADKVCKRVQYLIMHLNEYKVELTHTVETQHSIEVNLQVLIKECGSLTETSDYLTQVTGTLTALGNCPGLNGVSFTLPTWVGHWAEFKQEIYMSDDDVDAAMNQACVDLPKRADDPYKNVRAAEASELDEQSVQGMPKKNTGKYPLLGACPMCEGDDVDGGGHGRLCWDNGEVIGPDTKRGDCHSGRRVVLCVYEPTTQPTRPEPKPYVNPPQPYQRPVNPPQPYQRSVNPTQPYQRPVNPTQPYQTQRPVNSPRPYQKPANPPKSYNRKPYPYKR